MYLKAKITTKIDDFSIAKALRFIDEGIYYEINKDGFQVDSGIKKSKVVLRPSIKKGLHKQNTKEISTSLSDYEFAYEFKL